MTEATMKADPAAKTRTSKPPVAVEPFSSAPKLGGFDFPKFDFPRIEFPAVLRDLAEKNLEQARAGYEMMKMSAEEASVIAEDAYAKAAKGVSDYGLKVLDHARLNANAAFDFARDLIAAKSPSEMVELSTSHVRKQFDALTAQTRELAELAQKAAAETVTPVREAVSKSLSKVS